MSDDRIKRAAEMLLGGATLLAQPCPYCSGVRVMKDGRALCASCGREPRDEPPKETATPDSLEQQMLELTQKLGTATDPGARQRILESISELSGRLASMQEKSG